MSSISGEATLQAPHIEDADRASHLVVAAIIVAAMTIQGAILLFYRPWAYVWLFVLGREHCIIKRHTPSQFPNLRNPHKPLPLSCMTTCSVRNKEWLLPAFRVLVLAYTVQFTVWQYLQQGPRLFKFYTIWNWYLLVLYFAIVTVLSTRQLLLDYTPGKRYHNNNSTTNRNKGCTAQASPPPPSPNSPFASATPIHALQDHNECNVHALQHNEYKVTRPSTIVPAGWLGSLARTLLHINLTTVLLVDILTWTVLVPMLLNTPDPTLAAYHWQQFTSYDSLIQHGLNAVLVYADVLLQHKGGAPLEAHYLGWVSLWSAGYAAWAVGHFWATGVWMYPFLDTARPWAPFAYLGLFCVHWLAFLLGPMTIACVLRGQSSTIYQALSTVPLSDKQAAVALRKRASTAAAELQKRTSSLLMEFLVEE